MRPGDSTSAEPAAAGQMQRESTLWIRVRSRKTRIGAFDPLLPHDIRKRVGGFPFAKLSQMTISGLASRVERRMASIPAEVSPSSFREFASELRRVCL
jgi:hypothetical protein